MIVKPKDLPAFDCLGYVFHRKPEFWGSPGGVLGGPWETPGGALVLGQPKGSPFSYIQALVGQTPCPGEALEYTPPLRIVETSERSPHSIGSAGKPDLAFVTIEPTHRPWLRKHHLHDPPGKLCSDELRRKS